MANDNFNPVPEGRAGTGAAVIFGPTTDGLSSLRYLQRVDLMAAKQKERAAQQKVKEQEAGLKSFLANSKLSDEGGVHFGPQLKAKADEFYRKNNALLEDRTLTPTQRALLQQPLRDEYNRTAKATVSIDKHLGDTIRAAAADKRINTEAAARLVYGTLYDKDGAGISPTDYDPQTATAALTVGNEHLVAPEIYSQFLDKQPENSITYSQEALPGGRGRRQVAKSNIFELTADGQIKRDPATNKPVLRDTPETLAAFDSDAINRQYLDGFERVHKQQLAGAVEKMSNHEQLTPEEAEAVRVEQSPAGRRMELFKRGLLQYGYGREETALLAKAAPRPPVGRAPKTPTTVVSNSTEFLPGAVLGGRGANGTPGIVSYGMMPAVTYGKPGEEAKKYRARVKHQEVVTQRDDGSPASVNTANQTVEELEYGTRHLLLRGKNGTVFFPPKAALLAAQQGDFGPSEVYARQLRATHPDVKPEWYVEATPVGKSDRLPRPAKDSGEPTDKERVAPTRTHYVRYYGQDKLAIDKATQYALRDKKVVQAMASSLAETEVRTRPEQRTTPKKSIGIDFGTKPAPTATPTTVAPTAPTIKRAGTRKTGIQF